MKKKKKKRISLCPPMCPMAFFILAFWRGDKTGTDENHGTAPVTLALPHACPTALPRWWGSPTAPSFPRGSYPNFPSCIIPSHLPNCNFKTPHALFPSTIELTALCTGFLPFLPLPSPFLLPGSLWDGHILSHLWLWGVCAVSQLLHCVPLCPIVPVCSSPPQKHLYLLCPRDITCLGGSFWAIHHCSVIPQ